MQLSSLYSSPSIDSASLLSSPLPLCTHAGAGILPQIIVISSRSSRRLHRRRRRRIGDDYGDDGGGRDDEDAVVVVVAGGRDAAGEHGAGAGLHHRRPPPFQARAQRGHGALRPPHLPQPHRCHHRRAIRLVLRQGDGAEGGGEGGWVDLHQRAVWDRAGHGAALLRPPRHHRRLLRQLPQPHPRGDLRHRRAAPRGEAGGGDTRGAGQDAGHGHLRGRHHGGQPLQGQAAAPVAHAPAQAPRRRPRAAAPPAHGARHRLPVRQLPGLRALVHRPGPGRQGVPLQVPLHPAGLRVGNPAGAGHRRRHRPRRRRRRRHVAPGLGPAPRHRRLLGGVQHGRHLLPHLLGHRAARAHLPLHVQLPGVGGHHGARLAAAGHRRLRGKPARDLAHRPWALRLPLGQSQRARAAGSARGLLCRRRRRW